jgi:hypothetical protein
LERTSIDFDVWKGTATLYVRMWYDQSVGAKHLFQGTNSLQCARYIVVPEVQPTLLRSASENEAGVRVASEPRLTA